MFSFLSFPPSALAGGVFVVAEQVVDRAAKNPSELGELIC